MTNHGELEEEETQQVLGALVVRAVDHLQFAPDAQAKVGFSVDGVAYELIVQAKPV